MRSRWRNPMLIAALLGWVSLIFGTSCTVVRPLEFFAAVKSALGLSDESTQQFAAFWAVCWFGVVKGWHATEFALLTILVYSALRRVRSLAKRSAIGCSLLAATLFAASDEWHQTFVPDRMGTVTDVFFDCIGIYTVGAVLLWWRAPRHLRIGEEAPSQKL